jgi:hypothetical protein
MPSSPIWGFSRCPKSTDWRANPDAETTDWRARRGRTAHRVRREGTATAVPYPYPLAELRQFAGLLARPKDTAVRRRLRWRRREPNRIATLRSPGTRFYARRSKTRTARRHRPLVA